jgi:hypothetical protein
MEPQTTGGKDEPDIVFIRHNNVIRYNKLLDLIIRKHTNINLNIIVQYLLYWFIVASFPGLSILNCPFDFL